MTNTKPTKPRALHSIPPSTMTSSDLSHDEAKLVVAFRTMSKTDAVTLFALAQARSFAHLNKGREHKPYVIIGWIRGVRHD